MTKRHNQREKRRSVPFHVKRCATSSRGSLTTCRAPWHTRPMPAQLPASSGTITRSPAQPQWVRDARQAWSDIRNALAEGSRSNGRFSQPRVRAALQRAANRRPSWFELPPPGQGGVVELAPFGPHESDPTPAEQMTDGHGLDGVEGYEDADNVGDDPAAPASMTPAQERTLRDRARAVVRDLQSAWDAAREYNRQAADETARTLANATEAGLTAIMRPLSNAFATATAPAQRGAGLGLGLGLVLAALVLLK